MIYALWLGGAILFLLTLRFVLPELIYSLRYYLTRVRSTKTLLDSEDPDEDLRSRFAPLLVKDHRYEVLGYDEEYAFDRATKLRRLYHVLDLKRGTVPGLPDKREPQVCVIELAKLIGNLATNVVPDPKFHYRRVDANEILTFIGNKVRESMEVNRPMVSERQVVDWFTEFPLSIEQAIEILIAAVHGLGYRQRAQKNESLADIAPSLNEVRRAINRLRNKMIEMVRSAFEKKYFGQERIYDRLRELLGDEAYKAYCSASPGDRSLFDSISLEHLEELILNERDIFQNAFGQNDWLKNRIKEILPLHQGSLDTQFFPRSDLLLAVRYCHDIEKRIELFQKKKGQL